MEKNPEICSTGLETGCKPVLFNILFDGLEDIMKHFKNVNITCLGKIPLIKVDLEKFQKSTVTIPETEF